MVYGSIHYDVIAKYPQFPMENDRLFPQAITLAPGGMGGNVSAIFSRLGGNSRFVGSFSNDADGEELRRDLERDGVDTSWAGVRSGPGTRGIIMVDGHGERAIVGYYGEMLSGLSRATGQGPATVLTPSDFARGWREEEIVLPRGVFEHPVTGFYCPMNFAPALLSQVPDSLPVFIDAESVHFDHMSIDSIRGAILRTSILFANSRSFARLRDLVGVNFLADAKKFIGITLVETLGERGCRIHTARGATSAPGCAAEAIDTTGAGDSFAAAFIFSHLSGSSMKQAGEFACHIAALGVQALGSRPGVPMSVTTGSLVESERY